MSLRAAKTCEDIVFKECLYGVYTGQYPTHQNCVYEESIKRCGSKTDNDFYTDSKTVYLKKKSNVKEIEYLQSSIARNKRIIGVVALVSIGYLMFKK
jgi:hypothetical protein